MVRGDSISWLWTALRAIWADVEALGKKAIGKDATSG
jgi:hypothetical protein